MTALPLGLLACLGGTPEPPATERPAHGHGAPCSSCHEPEAAAWTGSHHDLAFEAVPPATPRGAFDGAPVATKWLTARPYVDDAGTPRVEVTEPAGVTDLPVVALLGTTPLQQVLLEGPGGRLLVAPVAWDVEGGRWYDPAVDGTPSDPTDPRHWAGFAGTWNTFCADCHATAVTRGYGPAADAFTTRFEHEDVACESCHGRGAEPLVPRTLAAQVDTCGPCHSRRQPLADAWRAGSAYLDHYRPALRDAQLYFADGSPRPHEEVFVLGSYLQGPKAAGGLPCTTCHDPHALGRSPGGAPLREGCVTCHPAAALTDHEHPPGPGCGDCHMPEKVYMGLDFRADHRFALPDPATAAAVGAPDPCTTCHTERDAAWAADALERWTGRPASVDPLALAFSGAHPNPAAVFLATANSPASPPFVRASAVAALRAFPPQPAPGLVPLLTHPDPTLRREAAVTLAAGGEPAHAWPLLDDPVRSVRFGAVEVLAGLPPPDPGRAAALDRVVAEYVTETSRLLDLPAPASNLGALHARLGRWQEAEAAFRHALRLAPGFAPARENLAVALLRLDRRAEAEAILAGADP